MKFSFLFILIFLVGCAATPPPAIRMLPDPGRILADAEKDRVRRAEQVKAYPLGRYIDPYNPHLMHEGHTIYRVESTAKWNLLPDRNGAALPRTGQRASSPVPLTRDELVMELNRQREATKAVIQGGRTVSEKLTELSEAMSQAKEVAERNLEFQKALDDAKQRLDALEKEAAGQRNGIQPQPSPNDKIEW